METNSKPTAWLEVIDPVTGAKVDIVVSFRADWPNTNGTVADDVNRIAGAIVSRLVGATTGPTFVLSDLEEAS